VTTDDAREKLTRQLIRHEGVRLFPYQDTVGKWTIGVGRNISDKGLTHDEAMMLLEHDIDECLADCLTFPWFADLDPVRQRVLIDMRFNLGPTGLRTFRTTLPQIGRGKFALAAANMLRSRWAGQVGQRAIRLSEMMRTGKEPLWP
jgi:lysozyme